MELTQVAKNLHNTFDKQIRIQLRGSGGKWEKYQRVSWTLHGCLVGKYELFKKNTLILTIKKKYFHSLNPKI